jgi:hypothetical protein
MAYLKVVSSNLVESTWKWHERSVHFMEFRTQDSAVQSSSGEQYHRWVENSAVSHVVTKFCWSMLGNALEYPAFCCVDEVNTVDATLCLVKKENSVSVDLLSRIHKSFGQHFKA